MNADIQAILTVLGRRDATDEAYAMDLSMTDIGWAHLRGADLSDADLSAANLTRANLSRADLGDADLSGVIGFETAPDR
jgi:uncharacterized protein YjbI with pentapeptide repeats